MRGTITIREDRDRETVFIHAREDITKGGGRGLGHSGVRTL